MPSRSRSPSPRARTDAARVAPATPQSAVPPPAAVIAEAPSGPAQHSAGAASSGDRADESQPQLHVRELRPGQGQPVGARRGDAGRRAPDVVQPAVRLRRRRTRQNPPHPGNRQPDILERDPAAKIRYIHAETYVSDVVRAYQHKAFDDFKRYYRSLDLLLIDDIQFFNGKNRTQEEFFYLFNTLIEAHKQVVITCDTYPKEISGIEERLISRFGWGLTVALEPPELEMRVAILLVEGRGNGTQARRAGRLLHRASISARTCANSKAR